MQDWDWVERRWLSKRAEYLKSRLIRNREQALTNRIKIENLMKTAGLDIMTVDDFDQEMAKALVKASNGNTSLVSEKDEENALI